MAEIALPSNVTVEVRQLGLLEIAVNFNGQVQVFGEVGVNVQTTDIRSVVTADVKNPIVEISLAARGVKGDFASIPIFIQPEQPATLQPYYWIQTNVNGDSTRFTEWFYDGVQ